MKRASDMTAKKYYGIYSLFFVMISTMIFITLGYYGKTMIDNHDALNQYYAAFEYFSDYVQNIIRTLFSEGRLELPLWDFKLGMGSDVLTSLNYYVIGDPLNLIDVFFPNEWLEVVFQMLIVFRLYLAGLAFSMFCRKIGYRKWHTAVGAYLYVFSMFALYSSVMYAAFPNVLIYLPLLLLGIEKVFRGEKSYVLLFTITLCLVSNFYFSYMLAILAVIYCFIRYFTVNAFLLKSQKKGTGEIVKDLFGYIGRMVLPIGVGALLSCAILLPVLYAFLHQGRGAGQVVENLFIYPLSTYAELLGSAFSPKIAADYNLMGYCPIVFFVILLVFQKGLGQCRKKRFLQVSFLVCAVFLCIPFFGYALNGFAYLNSRWIFGLSFLCGMAVVIYFEELLVLAQKRKVICMIGVFVYVMVYLLWDDLHTETIATSVIWILAFLVFLLAVPYTKLSYQKKYLLLTGLCMICIVYYGNFFFSPKRTTTLQSKVDAGATQTLAEDLAAGATKEIDDTSFYRVDVMEDSTLNEGLLLRYPSVAFYYSLFDGKITELNKELLNAEMTVPNMCHGNDGRTYMNLLSNVKYVVSDVEGYVPFGYKKLTDYTLSDGTVRTLSQNKLKLPFGYTVDSYFSKEEYQKLTPLQKEQVMLQGAVMEENPGELQELSPVFSDKNLPYQVKETNGVEIKGDTFRVIKPEATITLQVDVPESSEVFVYGTGISYLPYTPLQDSTYYLVELNSTMDEKMWEWKYRNWKDPTSVVIQATMNNRTDGITLQQESYKYYWGQESCLLSLGTKYSGKQNIVLKFSNIGEYTFSDLQVVAEDLSGLPGQVNELKTETLEERKFAANWIEGKVTTTGNKLLMLSVPYSEGWSVWVDGKEQPLQCVNTMWAAVYLEEAGTHKIEMQYRTPGLIPGLLISFVTLLGIGCFVGIEKVRKRRKNVVS